MPGPRVIGVTGGGGFIGGAVLRHLERDPNLRPIALSTDEVNDSAKLAEALRGADAVIHLAARNRADDEHELYRMNVALVETLVEAVQGLAAPPHIVFASSTKRTTDTPYGRSKRMGEELLCRWARESGGGVTIMELPNVFGPGGRPFYNSVVATFAWSFARGTRPEIVEDRDLDLMFVTDAADLLIRSAIEGRPGEARGVMAPVHRCTVSHLFSRFAHFAQPRADQDVPPATEATLDRLLYATYQSYLEPDAI